MRLILLFVLLLGNRGHLITFDNWHNAGYGQVVAMAATWQLC